ncbi:hypothetical protein HYW55_06495 [Candidatus Gottesmanbacteria bacterium]|nr:hypothetical protein [Candidatus Gottesmanbacteria bacterium]
MKKNLIFIAAFSILGLIALQIPFTQLLGASVNFTLYDFLAPSIGAFTGTTPGIVAVFLTQIINIFLHGSQSITLGSIIRLFPVLFAVFYFSKKRSVNILIPLVAIAGFNLHPIGRSAWQYSLLWLIPVAAHFYRKNLFVRSLGATFTAHAVGGLLWVWAFGLSKTIWLALIPQTLMERTLFAAGISISYVVITNLLSLAEKKKLIPSLHLEKQYLRK